MRKAFRSQATRGLTREERTLRRQQLRNQAARDEAVAALGERWVFHPRAEQHEPPRVDLIEYARQRRQMAQEARCA